MAAERERLVTLEELLTDPVLVAVADAYVRTEWASVAPPTWNTLAERMAEIERQYGRKEAEQQAWGVLKEAKRFLAMHDAAIDAQCKQIEKENEIG